MQSCKTGTKKNLKRKVKGKNKPEIQQRRNPKQDKIAITFKQPKTKDLFWLKDIACKSPSPSQSLLVTSINNSYPSLDGDVNNFLPLKMRL